MTSPLVNSSFLDNQGFAVVFLIRTQDKKPQVSQDPFQFIAVVPVCLLYRAGSTRRRIMPTRRKNRPTTNKNWSASPIYLVGRPMSFIFPLYCGQRLVTDRPIEIDLFGQSQRLVWTTKQSSNPPVQRGDEIKGKRPPT